MKVEEIRRIAEEHIRPSMNKFAVAHNINYNLVRKFMDKENIQLSTFVKICKLCGVEIDIEATNRDLKIAKMLNVITYMELSIECQRHEKTIKNALKYGNVTLETYTKLLDCLECELVVREEKGANA